MKKIKYIRNLLFLLFVIYYAQGSLYAQGSIIAKASLALVLVISGFYCIKTLLDRKKKNFFYKAWTALLLLNIVGFVFTANFGESHHVSMLKGILVTSLSFYPFYYFAQRGLLKSKHLLIFFLVMIPITILQYFFNANQILLERLSDSTELVNNIAYSFVALIPFVFLFKEKKVYSIASMALLMFFIIQGGKRGALIAGVIGLLFFIYYQLKTIDKRHRYRSYLLVLIGVLGLGYFAYDVFQNNEFLIARMQKLGEAGGSSGRDIIYMNLFNAWFNSDSLFHLLFGYGFAASLYLSGTGNFAHNDWLELLSNFGLLGALIYALLFYAAIKYIRNKSWDIDKRLLLLTIVSIWFFSTLVSMSYTSMNGYIQSVFLAYLIGSNSKTIE